MIKMNEIYTTRISDDGNREKITLTEYIIYLIESGDTKEALLEIVGYLSDLEKNSGEM